MDFYAETEKRKAQLLAEICGLAYERFGLCKRVESDQRHIAEIDELIAVRELKIGETQQVQRNFNTYLAVREGAVTLDQVKQAIEEGADLRAPETKQQENDNA